MTAELDPWLPGLAPFPAGLLPTRARARAAPGARHALYRHYHDHEWGFPVADDRRLFEKICLEGFQSGLSWLTIPNKREGFRARLCELRRRAGRRLRPG